MNHNMLAESAEESWFDAAVRSQDVAMAHKDHDKFTSVVIRKSQSPIALTTSEAQTYHLNIDNTVKLERQPVTVEDIRATHRARRSEIRARLGQFKEVWRNGRDDQLWEELVYCIFTAGASAKMGLRAVEAVRPFLLNGKREQMTRALRHAGAHRFPVERPGYIVVTRAYLRQNCRMALRKKLQSFSDPIERRDWLAREKQIKGLGYKESSHFLRNIGLMGHAILDKHVMSCLADLQVVDTPRPPATRTRYLETEATLKEFAREIKIDFDELDLVLWSMKTGEVLK